jgi:RNA recognition motif-containing protein
MLDTLRRAVLHVPWSGTAWARYILSAEEAGLSFPDMESIKHAATNSSQLDRDGMGAVLEMYSAWCGYLKRTAMNPTATEEAVDLAEIGLPAALEDVQHWGKRRYGDAYQGDPSYRLEKIYIQFLTEKKDCPEEARRLWERLSNKDIHANSYDFWLNYYLWEMVEFASSKNKARSPTPATLAQGLRVPSLATQVFIKALHRRTLDWPERVMEVYLQHCNDYELPDTLRQALDTIHKTRKSVAKRREKEAAYTQAVPQQQPPNEVVDASPGSKRKREVSPGLDKENFNKRARSDTQNGTETSHDELHQQELKRDRENTSVFVSNLPPTTDMKKLRQYFRDYGHIVKLDIKSEGDGESEKAIALVEFGTPEEAQSALLKDGKYFGQDVIAVKPASGCTLFVTNYPPTAGEKYIRELFKDCGKIFNVRFPSLKYNAHRRFCYVTFFDKDAAYAATKLDGKLIDGKFRLQSKYSDPGARQQRSGAQAEEREIHVRNLHPDLAEDDVKSLFAKHGNVQDVRIPRDMSGKSRGTAFVDMETKEQAQVAIKELDKASYRNRVLTVELSKSTKPKTTAVSRGTPGASASPSPGPSGRDEEDDELMHDAGSSQSHSDHGRKPKPAEIAARTIAILGLPDTVNDARVRVLIEPLGEIVKLTLHPLHGGATVEFANAAVAGKAALAIEGMEIEEGRKLRVGTVAELFKEKGETRIDRIDIKPAGVPKAKGDGKAAAARALMPPPSTLRRGVPVLGGRRGRGGLGFVGGVRKNGVGANGAEHSSAGPNTAPSAVAETSGGESEVAGATAPKKMSPDDFRKLL